jgi:hypothetical protein
MSIYKLQTKRIRQKLAEAKKKDPKLKVFGASYHKYRINSPAEEGAISKFEQQYDVQLPDCYKSFLLDIGNGGVSHAGSAAGPYYGIYPLGVNVNELIYADTKQHLHNECLIFPEMSTEDWIAFGGRASLDNIVDEEYERETGRIYGGILPIGSQGCSAIHGIVLNGEHRGRVINLDVEGRKPLFTFEANFLDWYERWLDEVISGELVTAGPTWFGYTMKSTQKEALQSVSVNDAYEGRGNRKNWFQFWK